MYDVDGLLRQPGFLAGLARAVDEGAPPPLLRCAKVKVTSRCNLRCVMCKYWHTRTEETLSTPRWLETFSGMAALGCRKIHFSGGEVFLRPDFLDLVDGAVRLGMKVNFTTNGTLLDRERAKRTVAVGTHAVSVSLDGPTAASHDAVRGRDGAFRKSLRAVRLLRKASDDLTIRVNFVLMAENFRRLPEMVRLAAGLGANELVPMPVDEKGARKNRLSRAQVARYNREVAPLVAEERRRAGFSAAPHLVFPFGTTDAEVRASADGLYAQGSFGRRPCLAPWLHLFAAWNGDVFLCCMTNGRMTPLGNLGRQEVRDVFRGEPWQGLRRDFAALRHRPECARCDLFLRENARLHAALDELGEAAGAVEPRSPFLAPVPLFE